MKLNLLEKEYILERLKKKKNQVERGSRRPGGRSEIRLNKE